MILNANPNPEIMPVEMTQHKVNYFIGKDPSKWQKGISTSKAVIYKNIYKNIDFNVDMAQIPVDYSQPVRIKKDVKENIKYKTIYPNHKGITTIRIKELQRMEIHVAGPGRKDGKGFQLVGDRLRPLPIGSTFDAGQGVFYWLPGPGFIGTYRLVFIEVRSNGKMRKKFINVEIIPKFMKKER